MTLNCSVLKNWFYQKLSSVSFCVEGQFLPSSPQFSQVKKKILLKRIFSEITYDIFIEISIFGTI